MPTDAKALARDVVSDVREACEKSGRSTTDAEVRRTLEALSPAEIDAVRRVARAGLTAALGPDALVDVTRGVAVHVAAAREVGGYYTMKAERDALATLSKAKGRVETVDEDYDDEDYDDEDESYEDDDYGDEFGDDDFEDDEEAMAAAARDAARDSRGSSLDEDDDEISESDEYVDEEVEESPKTPKRVKSSPADTAEAREQTQVLMTLFAYHRDAVRVAQELSIGLGELSERIDALKLRRRIHRLLEQTTDIEVFTPSRPATPGNISPVVRKRGSKVERPMTSGAEAIAAFERSVPAAQTNPVNDHGTRVYRRSPDVISPQRPNTTGELGVRREYVRETRKRARVVPAIKPPAAPKPVQPPRPAAPARPPFSELQGPGGRTILEKLLADEKANPRVLAKKLAERFEGPAGRAVNESDLRSLLKAHGLAERFNEQEIANTRFMLGFHQGARAKLANALLLEPQELDQTLSRLGLSAELERIRAERSRIELGRKRIGDRIAQVLTRAPYLDDLGVLPVIDREVREHLEQLFSRMAPEAVRAELGIEPNPFAKLLRRYELGT